MFNVVPMMGASARRTECRGPESVFLLILRLAWQRDTGGALTSKRVPIRSGGVAMREADHRTRMAYGLHVLATRRQTADQDSTTARSRSATTLKSVSPANVRAEGAHDCQTIKVPPGDTTFHCPTLAFVRGWPSSAPSF